jgi:2-keto-3-deoxy-L-rhamnonate aldolase RhmA
MTNTPSLIRQNPVRDLIKNGNSAFGFMAFEFFTPGLMSISEKAGCDFIILDMEHSGAGIDTIKSQLAFARGTSVVPIVRVPGSAYHLIAPILDAGALGIMVPLVETEEQAREIVAACRYRPEGRRGLGFSVAHDDYSGGDVTEKIIQSNERTLVIALIESEIGIDNVEAIMAVPGIDVGWLGHYDLTDSMGFAADFKHPRFKSAVKKLLNACNKNGKTAGYLAGNLKNALEWHKMGFRCLCYGTDVSLFRESLAAGISGISNNSKKS